MTPFIDLFLDFEEALNFCKFKNFDPVLKFTYVDNVARDAWLKPCNIKNC